MKIKGLPREVGEALELHFAQSGGSPVVRFFAYFLGVFLFAAGAVARVVSYDLNVEYKMMNLTGKSVKVMAVGLAGHDSGVPAPTLEFTEGDLARVTVHNLLDVETSLHWHGILVPNDQDGVPGLNTPAIKPGGVYTYEFPIKQSGTYWYHSHSDFQEQRGVYGAIVIHPAAESPAVHADREEVLVLSDWSDRNPQTIMHILRTDNEWEQIRKGTQRGWIDDVQQKTLKKRLQSEWERMGCMDVADVSYDAFLINGARSLRSPARPGERVRLRVINASSSTYFHVALGKQPMQVVAADGMPVEPVNVYDILMGMGETYDLLITVPTDRALEFRATSQDVTGSGSMAIGQGALERAPTFKKPDCYSMNGMKMADAILGNPIKPGKQGHGNMTAAGMTAAGEPGGTCEPGEPGCDEPGVAQELSYVLLRSVKPTAPPAGAQVKEYEFHLTGNMWRYVWSFNNKPLKDADDVMIPKGWVVRFKLVNDTMMHHPLHLHGHFFRVVNGQGEFSPLKHTLDIAPMETRVIEFVADQEKAWIFHCHNLYHMDGMARVIEYPDAPGATTGGAGKMMPMGRSLYPSGDVTVTNGRTEGMFNFTTNKYDGGVRAEYGNRDGEYKFRAEGGRNVAPYLDTYAGVQVDNEARAGKAGAAAAAGVKYKLPLMIDARLGYGTRGLDYSVSKEFALKHKFSVDTKYGREYGLKEYNALLKYRRNRMLTIEGGYTEKGAEVGINIRK